MYNKDDKIIVMASGGIDSTVILFDLHSKGYTNVYPVILNYGQKTYDTEHKSLVSVCPFPLQNILEMDISTFYKGSSSKLLLPIDLWNDDFNEVQNDLPGRSLLLILAGLSKAKSINSAVIYFGFIDTLNVIYYDCKEEYLKKSFNLLCNEKVNFEIPLIHMSKEDVVYRGFKLNVPLGKTFSCHNNKEIHCGVCPNCLDRIRAFGELVNKWKKY